MNQVSMDEEIVLLGRIWYQMARKKDEIFVFIDQKAILTYYVPFHTVVYLIGEFAGDSSEVTQEMHNAARRMMN